MTIIIILNWNGWKDTIDCLKSLYQVQTEDFFIIVADNGSSDNSVTVFEDWLSKENRNYYILLQDEVPKIKIKSQDCILYKLKENYGFAKGNNYAVELAKQFSPDYFLLLNNDTEVKSDFLNELYKFVEFHPEYNVLTPLIRYYSDKNKIWNCGGKLFAGFRKYYYAGSSLCDIKEKEFIKISFITGCALFFKSDLVKESPIFSERFFFGEEDFEFSLKMRKQKVKMACILKSHVFHKVSTSVEKIKVNLLGMKHYGYLQRFIDVRINYGNTFFFFWKLLYFPYIYRYLSSLKIPFSEIISLYKCVWRESLQKDSVTKEDFEKLVKKGESLN